MYCHLFMVHSVDTYMHKADITGSDVLSPRSLLVVEERMSSSRCLPKHWLVTGRTKSLHQLPLMKCTFPPLPFIHCRPPRPAGWERHGGMLLSRMYGQGKSRGSGWPRSPRRFTYLDIAPPVPSGTLGDEFLPLAMITGNSLCSSPGDFHCM